MRRHRLLILALVLLLGASPAWASTNRAVRTEGNRLFREGTLLIEQGSFNEAMFRFERTLAYRNSPNVLWNLAACHIELGQRDLGLWFFERYLAHDTAAQQSLRVQQALTAIASEDEHMMDRPRRTELWTQLAQAVDAAGRRDVALAVNEQIVFRAGNTSADAVRRARVSSEHGTDLFRQGLRLITENEWAEAQTFFERSLAYRNLRNAAYNIASVHLAYGRRDLALHFYRLYVDSMPALRGNAAVAAVLEAIEDAPATIRDESRCEALSEQVGRAVSQALGESRPPA